MTTFGLVDSSDNKRIPLRSINVKGFVQGFVASVETKLVYENDTDSPVEAIFTFPIDDSSAVFKFEALIDGQLIVGECQEKGQARQTYQDAVAAGETAFLMEEKGDTGDIFECTVGNLPAHAQAEVTFTYVTQCRMRDNVATFVYPCVLSPRYTPDPAPMTNQASTSSAGGATTAAPAPVRGLKWSTRAAKDLPYKANATISVFCKKPLNIESVNTNIGLDNKSTFMDKTTAQLTSAKGLLLDQDIVVDVTYSGIFKPCCYTELGQTGASGILTHDMMMVQFKPELKSRPQDKRGEFIFVLDRSGSMGGDRIRNATKSLLKCMDMLPDNCYFNVVCFGTSIQVLFNDTKTRTGCSVKWSEDNIEQAKKKIKGMDADLGGTDMNLPFDWIYEKKCIKKYPRQVILLTDGQYYPLEPVANQVKKHNKDTRVFTMGIGFGASTSLVRTLARVGRGTCEFLREDMHKLQKQVESLLSCAMSPAMLDVSLTWDSLPAYSGVLIPTELPPVFLGQTLIAYVMLKTENATKTQKKRQAPIKRLSATLKGWIDGKEHSFTVNTDMRAEEDEFTEEIRKELPLHRLAAKAYIKQLEDDEEYNGVNKRMIVTLSIAANLMSRHASFVAVAKRKPGDKIKEKARQVDIPVAERNAANQNRGADFYNDECMMFEASEPEEDEREVYCDSGTTRLPVPFQPVMAAGTPCVWSYGGGSSDAPQLLKYINGKCPDVPEVNRKLKQDDMIGGKASEITSPQMEKAAEKTTNEHTEKAANDKAQKRKRSGKRLTVAKKTRRLDTVSGSVFAQWRDGYWYPAAVKSTYGSYKKVCFKDKHTRQIKSNQLIPAAHLSPGDVISVHVTKQTYAWAIILEYTTEYDSFLVAMGSGKIARCLVQDMVLPEATATAVRSRPSHDSEPKQLLNVRSQSGPEVTITTSDLAELSAEGWINGPITSFFIRKMLFHQIPDEVQKEILAFDCDILPLIKLENESKITPRMSRNTSVNVDDLRAHMEEVDVRQKTTIIFPIFDEVHWYVIVAKIEREPFQKNTFRGTFYTMDSYFESKRERETRLLKAFLKKLFSEAGCRLEIQTGAVALNVPAQTNECDCGLYALLCMRKTLQEHTQLSPRLDWFSTADAKKLRQEIAREILECSNIE